MTAPVRHPAWCDRARCTVEGEGGEHRSTFREANPAGALSDLRVWLEAVPEDATGRTEYLGTFLVLDTLQGGEHRVLLLGLRQGATLARILLRLVRVAYLEVRRTGNSR